MCKLYVSFTCRRPRASRPAAGGAAHAFGRERRWPSFISWRWAGPGLDGWIRCPWRVPPLQLPPPRLRHSAIMPSRRPLGLPPAKGPAPAKRRPSAQPSAPVRSPPGKGPGRALANPPREPNLPGKGHGRAPGSRPANQPRGRVLAVLPPGSGPRRVAGGGGRLSPGSPAGPGPRRN
jgi:hypothetical protein